jgi:threonylcarbamoyladenosine tRNA methylthiotransferase MtaB
MFVNSLKLVEDCGLTWLHVFPYSPRPGTPAARMPQVDGRAIRDRAARLRAAGATAVDRHLRAQVGKSHAVLMEHPTLGRTEQFTEVVFGTDQPEGKIVEATISGHNGSRLLAG